MRRLALLLVLDVTAFGCGSKEAALPCEWRSFDGRSARSGAVVHQYAKIFDVSAHTFQVQ